MISPKTLGKWWEAQPEGEYTCTGCGRVDQKAYVQPQHPFYAHGIEGTALCGDCIGKHNQDLRNHRRDMLDAMPRCEVTGCKRRAVCTAAGVVQLCNAHFTRAERTVGGGGIFGPIIWTREIILRAAVR